MMCYKKIIKPFLILNICLFFLQSCKKNNDSPAASYITFNSSGTNFNTSTDLTYKYTQPDPNTGTHLELYISGYSSDKGTEMELYLDFIHDKVETGVYPVDYSNDMYGIIVLTYISDNAATFASGGQSSYGPGVQQTGNITITAADSTHIAGTFSGILDLLGEGNNIQTKQITSGKFNVNF